MQRFITEKNRKWWTLFSLVFALFIVLLDASVVNLSIPSILRDLHTGIAQIEWVSNAYILTFAVLLISFGRLGDIYGRKKFFMTGIVLFGIGSLASGLAPSINFLIASRVLQGLGGAFMMPASLSLVSSVFPKKERGMAMGIWGASAGLAFAFGPIIGGFLTDAHTLNILGSTFTTSWRWVFFINIPIAIFAFIAAALIIREFKESAAVLKKDKIDIIGVILSTIMMLSLVFALIEGQKYGWGFKPTEEFKIGDWTSPYSPIPFLFMISAGFAVAFYAYLKKAAKHPLIDLKLFKHRNFTFGNLGSMMLSFGQLGAFFLLPLFLQNILGFSATKSGLVLTPMAITMMIAAPISGKISDKFGSKWLIFAGLLFASLNMFWFSTLLTDDIKILALRPPFIITGFAMGLIMAPTTSVVMKAAPNNEAGAASGILNTIRQTGSLLGVAVLGAFLQSSLHANEFQVAKNTFPNVRSAIQEDVGYILEKTANIDKNTKDKVDTALVQVLVDYDKMPRQAQDSIEKVFDQVAVDVKAGKNIDLNSYQQQFTPPTGLALNISPEQLALIQQSRLQKVSETTDKLKQEENLEYTNSIKHTFKYGSIFIGFGALFALGMRRKEEEKESGIKK